VVTNVPGPPVPIYSAGARLESMMGLLCLTDGLGLGHVVQSYVKEATIAFTACRKLLPDPEFYVQCLEDSFHELRDAAKNPPAPAPAAPAKPKAARPTAKKALAKKPAAKKPAKPAAKPRRTTNK
jgi:hypothetical protein